ncbi:hypothetical protein [Pantoea ananatis]|uniref:hypothetical protein n=1 Tax=Pantoea ananas TaxID=553 RepID=UPI001303A54D|nr:hypothetical protein [Pantoea ananatis]
MSDLSDHDLLKSQKIIDSMDYEELKKQALTVEEWIVNNSKFRKNYNNEREQALNNVNYL